VVHPNHPLSGQLVKVVRQTGHAAYAERQWVVELPDQTRSSLPLSWAVPVEGLAAERPETDNVGEDILCVDVSALLKLARMVRNLTIIQSEKGETHGQSSITPASIIGDKAISDHSLRPTASLGATASTAATGIDQATGDAAGQTTANPAGSDWTGGER
jgi:hypothetical protein